MFVVLDGVWTGSCIASAVTSPVKVAFCEVSKVKERALPLLIFKVAAVPSDVVFPKASYWKYALVVNVALLWTCCCITKLPLPFVLTNLASACIVLSLALDTLKTLPITKSGCDPVASKLPLTTKSPFILATSKRVIDPDPEEL